MRYGSLFSGYAGLDTGVQSVLGGETAWFCEIEKAPAAILAHHWPDVPNLGDITTVDWSAAEPVDVLTGGFPCQDVSHAGKRRGLKPGTRSGLWAHMAYAIDQLRPRIVIAENVRGLLSAEAGGDLEPCPWCVGDGERGALRALGAVLGDLADLGYDAWWYGLRAADVGAPHGRFRVFVVAHPAGDARRVEHGDDGAPADARRLRGKPGRESAPGQAARGRALAVPGERRGVDSLLPTPSVADTTGGRKSRSGDRSDELLLNGIAAANQWGIYADAIARWEHLTRPAPAPTQPSRKGAPQLSPAFSEWMMGLPAGHVTAVPGLSRNEQLKALGNGVVPQQAAAALRLWARHGQRGGGVSARPAVAASLTGEGQP